MPKRTTDKTPDIESVIPWGQSFLSNVIMSEDNRDETSRLDPNFVHVSATVGWCPRAYALQVHRGINPQKRVEGPMRVVWAIGRAVEKHVREQFIRGVNFVGVYGVWKCQCKEGGIRREGFYSRKTCDKCGHDADTYDEIDLRCKVARVTGHPDLIFIRKGLLYVVEIKSLTNSESANKRGAGFNAITRPFGDHVYQASNYQKMIRPLARKLGVKVARNIIVFYCSKDFQWRPPYYKEFHVDSTDEAHQQLLNETHEGARQAVEYVKSGGKKSLLPPRKLCNSCNCKRALECPVSQECFAIR